MALINFGYRVDMSTIASPSDPEGFIVAYDLDGYLKQKDYFGVVSLVGASSSNTNTVVESFTFSSDLVVSLSNGKTFGKYENGATIPAIGKTTSEVLIDSLSEPLRPILTLESNTQIKYNQNDIQNELTFSYDIISLGATVYFTLLEYRKNNTGDWIPLTQSPSLSTYTHEVWDPGFNTDPYNYRYSVIDTKGASSSITKNITPMSYIPPTINLSVVADVKVSPETNLKRERGNIISILSGSISRNTELVELLHYQLQFKKAGSTSWLNIGPPVDITGITDSIDTITHNDPTLSNLGSVSYRVLVTDTHQTTESTPINVEFVNLIFFGPASSVPTTSTQVRSLTGRIFIDASNPFILDTGITYSTFVAALPATFTIIRAIDLDATGANMPYSSTTLDVGDFDGYPLSYKIYSTTQAIPYPYNHKHEITRL